MGLQRYFDVWDDYLTDRRLGCPRTMCPVTFCEGTTARNISLLSFRSTLALSEERLSNLATVKILTYFDCVVTVCGGYMRSIT